MNLEIHPKALLGVVVVALTACSHGSSRPMDAAPDAATIEQGKRTFRFDTFGDESQWTDSLRMHEVIRTAVDPTTALSVGLKVDSEALPAAVVHLVDAQREQVAHPTS